MAKYQHTSNLENHYVTAGTNHKELADRLTSMQHIDRQERLGSAADGRIALSRTFVAPAFTADKKRSLAQHASTLTIHNCAESACSCVRLHGMKTDMLCVVQSKVRPQLGLAAGT